MEKLVLPIAGVPLENYHFNMIVLFPKETVIGSVPTYFYSLEFDTFLLSYCHLEAFGSEMTI